MDFNRTWIDYKDGFGDVEGEFWFGNENIYDLTKPSFAPKKSQLLINMRMKGKQIPEYVKYNTFAITDEATKYVLRIKGFSGNMTVNPKGLKYNNNQKFSTFDSDNDAHTDGNCAAEHGYRGGWWYSFCSNAYLNASYKFNGLIGNILWYNKQPEFVEMKMKRNM